MVIDSTIGVALCYLILNIFDYYADLYGHEVKLSFQQLFKNLFQVFKIWKLHI